MPRYPVKEKTIHGEPCTHQHFMNTVGETIASMEGGGRAADLIPTLGPEWDTAGGHKIISQTLINLCSRNKLKRVEGERGLYVVSNHYRRTGVNQFDEDEKAILRIIRNHGGFCQWSDILEVMGVRPHGSKQDRLDAMADPVYKRVYNTILKSDRIRQDITTQKIGTGVYNLPWEELNNLPMIGYYASLYIHYTYNAVLRANTGIETGPHDWYDEQELFFEQVGAAFKRLRDIRKLSLETLLEDKAIRAALMRFQQVADRPLAVIRGEWKDKVDLEVERLKAAAEINDGRTAHVRREEARAKCEAYTEEQRLLFNTKCGQWLYRKFENGDVGAHCNAPLILYMAVANHFEVCPAALSRGAILSLPDKERLRPGNNRRSAGEQAEAEFRNEQAVEATRLLLATPIEEL